MNERADEIVQLALHLLLQLEVAQRSANVKVDRQQHPRRRHRRRGEPRRAARGDELLHLLLRGHEPIVGVEDRLLRRDLCAARVVVLADAAGGRVLEVLRELTLHLC